MRAWLAKFAVLTFAVSAVLVAGVASPASAAQACTGNREDRSADNWTAIVTDLCLTAGGWSHGTIELQCWKGQTIGWTEYPCRLSGKYTITKEGHGEVFSKVVAFGTNGIGPSAWTQDLTFSCAGHGLYKITLSEAHATLNLIGWQGIYLPDRSVSVRGC